MKNFTFVFLLTTVPRETFSDTFLYTTFTIGIVSGIASLVWILFMETKMESREKTFNILLILFWLYMWTGILMPSSEPKLRSWLITVILILPLFVIGGFFLWKIWMDGKNETRCPNCQKPWARKYLRQELLGIFRKSERRYGFGTSRYGTRESDYQMVWYEKVKVHYQCMYCAHEWSLTKSIRQ